LQLLRASDGYEIAWKNGGGFTREIAAHPAGAGYEAFDWRVSLARIERDGPFSVFPGVDRLFAVVAGGGVELAFEDAPPLRLEASAAPVRFAGEAKVFVRLLDGEAVALNVMTRRDTRRPDQRRDVKRSQFRRGATLLRIGWQLLEMVIAKIRTKSALLGSGDGARKSRARAQLSFHVTTSSLTLPGGSGTRLWMALAGAGRLETAAFRETFGPGDAWTGLGEARAVSLMSEVPLRLVRIEIS
jgi:environmental stress-induced protein Ves